MKRHELDELSKKEGYPALTITLPTHRTSPENQQDPIRVRNLVEQASARLLEEFSKSEATPLLERLEKLVQGIDYRNTLDGLVLFVQSDFGRALQLPFTLKERVHVGKTFLTRDLVFAMNRTPRYWVLVLSEKPTRLYEGTRDGLMEVEQGGFPMVHEGPGGEQSLPGGFGIKKSAYRDEYHRKFFRQADAALKPFMAEDPLPLVLVGVNRLMSFFNEVTHHKDAVLCSLQGSHDKTSAHELGKMVWPMVQQGLKKRRRQVLKDLEKAVGEKKFASSIGEAWQMAYDGRGYLLLVEENLHIPARLDKTGRHLMAAEEGQDGKVVEDAVDEIIEMVLRKQGQVVFMEPGQLKEHQGMALILRY